MALSLPHNSDGDGTMMGGMPPLDPVDVGRADADASQGAGVLPPAGEAAATGPGTAADEPGGGASPASAPAPDEAPVGATPGPRAAEPIQRRSATASAGIRLEDPRAYPTMAGAPDDRWLRQLIGREGTWVTARNFRSAYLTVPDPREEGTYVPIVRENGERVAVDFLEASNNPDNDHRPPGVGHAPAGTRLGWNDEAATLDGSARSLGPDTAPLDSEDIDAGYADGDIGRDIIPPEDVDRIFADLEAWDSEKAPEADAFTIVAGTDNGPGDVTAGGADDFDPAGILADDEDDGIEQADPEQIPDPASLEGLIHDIQGAFDRGLGDLSDAERSDLLRRINEALGPLGALPVIGNILSAANAVEAFLAAFQAYRAGDPAKALRLIGEGTVHAVLATPAGTTVKIGKGAFNAAKKFFKLFRRRRPGSAEPGTGKPGAGTPNGPAEEPPPQIGPPPRRLGGDAEDGIPRRVIDGPGRPEREDWQQHYDASRKRLETVRENLPPAFDFHVPPEEAFASTDLTSTDPDEQVYRGLSALEMLVRRVRLGQGETLPEAMYRPDLPGDSQVVIFHWGNPGGKNFTSAHGWAHILSKHGPEAVEGVLRAIAEGWRNPERDKKKDSRNSEVVLEYVHKGVRYRAVLGVIRGRKGQEPIWVLTGYSVDDSTDKEAQAKPFDLRQLDRLFFD